MAELPAHPLANPYGGHGPIIMGVTWGEASLALVVMLLRTYTNAFIVKSFRWDYFWAMLTLVCGLWLRPAHLPRQSRS